MGTGDSDYDDNLMENDEEQYPPSNLQLFFISLTQTRKKGLNFKQNLVEEIRKCIDLYARVFVFSSQHIKTNKLKEIRIEWSHSKHSSICSILKIPEKRSYLLSCVILTVKCMTMFLCKGEDSAPYALTLIHICI
ncbi:mRNA turnover protein 4 [Portunus trituberculatus]|uniref:mRNA turnover protein 4 n=1 Tax=Portunus trituberculatus TaxID=210409 RepID=A0A5B7GVB8_PORTR|nr:mRNA turnover protein 4 [Portunus trituberculatus]